MNAYVNTRYILIAMIILTIVFIVFCKYQVSTVVIEPMISNPTKETLIVSPIEKQKGPKKSCCLNDPKYSVLGYDNPYIFPYNYCLNLNQPASRFKLPHWARRVQIAEKNSLGFPGYVY
jgi:hypothetical protein